MRYIWIVVFLGGCCGLPTAARSVDATCPGGGFCIGPQPQQISSQVGAVPMGVYGPWPVLQAETLRAEIERCQANLMYVQIDYGREHQPRRVTCVARGTEIDIVRDWDGNVYYREGINALPNAPLIHDPEEGNPDIVPMQQDINIFPQRGTDK